MPIKHQPSLHKEDLEEYKDTFIKNGIKAIFLKNTFVFFRS